MKRWIALILVICMLLCLAACRATEPANNETRKPENSVPESQDGDNSQPPYLQKINRADMSVWDGPGYDHNFVGTVEAAGTYTITEQVQDTEGNLWGKLKSGAGWVDLSQIRREETEPPIMTANYADAPLLSSGNYHHCIADASEYTVQVAFRAHEPLKDVSFFAIVMAGDTEETEELYQIAELDPDKPFVADVAFPGDMSMYGIRFTDSSGAQQTYSVTLSGRNNSLVFAQKTETSNFKS